MALGEPRSWYDSIPVGHFACNCNRVWGSVLPPPPCPIHGRPWFADWRDWSVATHYGVITTDRTFPHFRFKITRPVEALRSDDV